MTNSANKRKFPRRQCFVPIEGKAGSAFDQTQTIDISKGGIGFVSQKRVGIDERIAVELELQADTDPVLVVGRVQWVKPIANSDSYRIGLKFEEVLSESPSRLDEYFK